MHHDQGHERRSHPRVKFCKSMHVTCGKKIFPGYTYDISHGGLAFISENLPAAGELLVQIDETGFTFKGSLIGRQNSGKPGLFRYQMKFAKPLTREELVGIVAATA